LQFLIEQGAGGIDVKMNDPRKYARRLMLGKSMAGPA
jgi:hypothetical protein